jgi:hypothetical protein
MTDGCCHSEAVASAFQLPYARSLSLASLCGRVVAALVRGFDDIEDMPNFPCKLFMIQFVSDLHVVVRFLVCLL